MPHVQPVRTTTETSPRSTTSKPRTKKPRMFDRWTLPFLAKVLRYLAGKDTSVKVTKTKIHNVSHLATSLFKDAFPEMEKRGWIKVTEDLHHPRGEERANMYECLEAFPVPTTHAVITRPSRRFIQEFIEWPGKVSGMEMCFLFEVAPYLTHDREYSGGRDRLAQGMDVSGGQVSGLVKRFAYKRRIHVIERKPLLKFRVAGPSGFIEDVKVTYPDMETGKRRLAVFRFVTHPQNRGRELPAGAIAVALSLTVKQVREALYWLEKRVTSTAIESASPSKATSPIATRRVRTRRR